MPDALGPPLAPRPRYGLWRWCDRGHQWLLEGVFGNRAAAIDALRERSHEEPHVLFAVVSCRADGKPIPPAPLTPRVNAADPNVIRHLERCLNLDHQNPPT